MTQPIHDRAGLLAAIAADPALATLLAEARARGEDDPSHGPSHALRVALWTLRLGGEAVDPREGIAAALVHDAANLPKDSPDRARASERSAALAAARLPALGFSATAVARIVAAVRDHSFSRGATPRETLGRALQDADRLEALGAIGLLRCIGTGARMGSAWFHEDDPWAHARELDDARFSVDHFFTKLLRLPATLCTDAGRAEAARRVELLRGFLAHLGEELGEPAPPGERARE